MHLKPENSPENKRQSEVLFSTVLRPHRAATVRAIHIVIGFVAGALMIAGFGFILSGAWPVVPLLGLEVLLLFAALRLHHRGGNAYETIDLTENLLSVCRVDAWGRKARWDFQPQWLQVNMDNPPRQDSHLELRSHGKSIRIGGFLLPSERLVLANQLRRELTAI